MIIIVFMNFEKLLGIYYYQLNIIKM